MYTSLLTDEQKHLYGKGFSLYGLLAPEIKNVPPINDVLNRIREGYYTYIVYGSVQQCKLFLDLVIENYSSDKIIFIDGEDRTSIVKELTTKGYYFKRELINSTPTVYPIGFAIPAKKIVKTIPQKSREWAINYPGKLHTYIHKTEDSYYFDYQTSKFAVTFKKEGWDCLRHYEILANGCLPYFKDLHECPDKTLTNLPKDILLKIKAKIESGTPFSDEEYSETVNGLLEFTTQNLTTEALVDYVFKVVKSTVDKKTVSARLNFAEDAVILKTRFIDDALNIFKKNNPVIIHYSLSSVQELRYLQHTPGIVYAQTCFKSAIDTSWSKAINLLELREQPVSFADVIISDMTLPYQEDILDYMQNVIKAMNHDTRLIIVVPNYKSFSTVLGFIKNDLKFGRLTLAKTSQVNFYSSKSLLKFLKSFNLYQSRQLAYDFDNSHPIKRVLNKFNFLRYFTCRKLMIEARLKHE
ncbi:hypothetical protein ACQ86K_17620 [Mucilaginibacter sp. P19]|nr:hypothetical protein [Mucilaginibacter gossypii]